jgi:hypothetical protein
MRKSLIVTASVLVLGMAVASGSTAALAAADQAEQAYRAELKDCRKIADPGEKDDCVRAAKEAKADADNVVKVKDDAKAKAGAKAKDLGTGALNKAGKAKKQ